LIFEANACLARFISFHRFHFKNEKKTKTNNETTKANVFPSKKSQENQREVPFPRRNRQPKKEKGKTTTDIDSRSIATIKFNIEIF
jgi:hypothetical protein